MSTEFADSALAQIRDTIARLQSPIPDYRTVLQLLSAPLACLGLLPPRFVQYNVSPLPKESFSIPRHIPLLQRALLEHVIPTWEPELVREDASGIVEQYFCPDAFSFASPAAGQVAVLAYSTILSSPITEYSVRTLVRLCKSYPIDVLHSVVFSDRTSHVSGKQTITWEDCVRNAAAIPGKVANAMGGTGNIPPELEHGTYFNDLSVRFERLVYSLSTNSSRDRISSVTYLLTKLVNIGVFSLFKPSSPSQPSFFSATLPAIRACFAGPDHASYSSSWSKVLLSLSSTVVLQSVIASLCSSLADIPRALDPDARSRALVKREAQLLRNVLGNLRKDQGEIVDSVSAVVLGREWSEGHARIFACWAAGAEKDKIDAEALGILLSRVVDMWSTPDHIKHSLLSRHHYVTALLLLCVSSFRSSEVNMLSHVNALALSPPFITAISTYISHLDPSVRRCGMLVAEEVARGAGKKLDFGDWEGEDQGKAWCRQLRQLVKGRDADADVDMTADISNTEGARLEIPLEAAVEALSMEDTSEPGQPRKPTVRDVGYDSDDSLTGYASPSSSRSPSPTPSELEEIEKDPTLRVGKRKILRPVYLAQLGNMVRSSGGLKSEQEEAEAEKIEIALNVAEELIRRKRGYGTELEENAVNLAYGFVGLQDSYEIEGFEEKRQAALNVLVACCPRKTAPAIIEEFFRNQYSTNQRYVILNALVLGARELASLPMLPSSVPANRVSFPSKRLPPALHEKYITASDRNSSNNPAQLLLEGISREAIKKGKDATADKVPEIVRERQLRIRKPAKVTEVPSSSSELVRIPTTQIPPKSTTFTEVAAECFICPLINRFWLFLRDEQAREARTARQPALHRYRGAGTGLILNPVVLTRFLSALAVLVHTARNAPEWLAVVAPDALELAVTLGTRPISAAEGEDEDEDADGVRMRAGEGEKTGKKGKEAAVLTTALELALVVLDGCLEVDGGRSLGLEHTALLLGTGEWAGQVFSRLEKGIRMLGGGGEQEARLQSAAAGVILKVDELSSRWRRSMIEV
ncbi:telomeric DNA binding protein [Sparassis crispa]|uniref:Telomeric DNA binding protein n=1 Tax=Sparassis crispa TaxID=139825 RepID=A0A401GJU9_9APHY|nr:telomeric DNA binding protein [Sparassis crispa]GBE82448.1 telomeric DNA binding protein [Sparassis crispa]